MNNRDCVGFLQWALPRLGLHWPGFRKVRPLRVLATDIDDQLLERAAIGCYGWSSLKETPRAWSEQAFERRGGAYCVREAFRESVTYARQDIRLSVPDTRFDLILCRNVVLTYFEPEVRHAVMRRVADALRPGGALVVGMHETLPQGMDELVAWPEARAVFRRVDEGSATVSSLEHGAESPLA